MFIKVKIRNLLFVFLAAVGSLLIVSIPFFIANAFLKDIGLFGVVPFIISCICGSAIAHGLGDDEDYDGCRAYFYGKSVRSARPLKFVFVIVGIVLCLLAISLEVYNLFFIFDGSADYDQNIHTFFADLIGMKEGFFSRFLIMYFSHIKWHVLQVVFFPLGFYLLFHPPYRHKNVCPHCKLIGTFRQIDKKFLGSINETTTYKKFHFGEDNVVATLKDQKSGREIDVVKRTPGHFTTEKIQTTKNKYKYMYRCDKCNHKKEFIKYEKQ